MIERTERQTLFLAADGNFWRITDAGRSVMFDRTRKAIGYEIEVNFGSQDAVESAVLIVNGDRHPMSPNVGHLVIVMTAITNGNDLADLRAAGVVR